MATIPRNILVIIGTGGMGLAIARRLAAGKTVFLADASSDNLTHAAEMLSSDGHSSIHTHLLDVSNYDSVRQFATAVASSSPSSNIETIVHTAGVSPSVAPPTLILQVNLVGTANIIDAFSDLVTAGSSLTCISSITRFRATDRITPSLSEHLSAAPRETLLTGSAELVDLAASLSPEVAYSISKAGNVLRVQAATRSWAAKGARVNTVTPGAIMTDMLRRAMQGPAAGHIDQMLKVTPMERAGAADEVAGVVAFLAGRDASFVTGADVVVDGGFTAGNPYRWRREGF